jgi:hypothetical protein
VRGRRTAVTLLAAGTTCLAAGALPLVAASAEAEPGSGLGSFSLSANAPVMQARFDYAAQQCGAQEAGTGGCEGVVNESVSQLSSGPVGYGLSSIAWPGQLAGNLGTLLIVAGSGGLPVPVPVPLPPLPPPPSQVTVLNSPIRAEARTGRPSPVITDYPGHGAPSLAHMVATATATRVSTVATVGAVQSTAIGTLGTSSSSTSTTLTGPSTAESKAHSQVQDVIIGGVIHLGTVTSDAVATTNGTTATVSGATVITGASIAGVPVTIDGRGITVQSQHVPIPDAATATVNNALKGAGITVAMSTPVTTRSGASATYSTGSLVLVWKVQDGMTISVTLGGAQVRVASSPAFVCGAVCLPPPPGGGTTGGTTTGGVVVPPTLTGNGNPGSTTGGLPSTTGQLPVVASPTASRFALPRGLSPWHVVLVLLGSGLLMAGFRRLPDSVLATSSTDCPQGESA